MDSGQLLLELAFNGGSARASAFSETVEHVMELDLGLESAVNNS